MHTVDEPSSPPPNMTPPPLLRCLPAGGSELDVTPPPPAKQPPRRIGSSPPLRSSTPPLRGSTPPLVHSSPEKLISSPIAITARVIRHNSDQSSPPMAAASSDKELNTSSGEEEGSWASLPQQRQESGGLDDVHQQEVPEAVGSRVEQLTKMVENLTAKFVLLENHLKLATEVQGERHGSTDGDAVEREKEREEGERKLPLRDITREVTLKQAHGSVNQPQSTGSPTKQPLSTKRVNKSMSDAAVSQREATPLSSVISTPDPSSKRMPPSSVGEDYIHQRYTSHATHSLKLDFATPSTPVGIQNARIKILAWSIYYGG